MNKKILIAVAALGAGALVAVPGCSEAPLPPEPPPLPPPAPPPGPVGDAASLELISGDGQNGRTLAPLELPLVVRATDAEGNGVEGVTVSFEVAEGGGEVVASEVATDAEGRASVELTLGPALGPNRVTATAEGLDGSPVTLTAIATVLVIEISGFAFRAPDGSDAITVAVGDTIEWVNRDGVPHTVTANQGPNGNLFDSGILGMGAAFRLVPDERGAFEYFCQVHPAQMRGATIAVE